MRIRGRDGGEHLDISLYSLTANHHADEWTEERRVGGNCDGIVWGHSVDGGTR